MVKFNMWFVKVKCQTWRCTLCSKWRWCSRTKKNWSCTTTCCLPAVRRWPQPQPAHSVPVQENNKLASSELANYFPRCAPVLVRLGLRQSSSITPCHQVEGGRQKYPKQKEKDFSLFKETCCKKYLQGLRVLARCEPCWHSACSDPQWSSRLRVPWADCLYRPGEYRRLKSSVM